MSCQSLQHVNKKDPAMLQRGGLSGGATSADSKKIYPIDISNTTSDSSMYVKDVASLNVIPVHVFCVLLCVLLTEE